MQTKIIFFALITLLYFSSVSYAEESNALIILDAWDVPSMKRAIQLINDNGGRIIHTYPTHILIGHVPRNILNGLVGSFGIIDIYYSAVDPSIVKEYNQTAKYAVEAWNNNFMGQAKGKGLTPKLGMSDPGPILNDCIFPDEKERERREKQIKNPPSRILQAPYGAGFYDTSEYMIGSIAVGVILPESDPWTFEDWDSTEESQVISEIQAGLNWWVDKESNANISFTYEIYYGRLEDKAKTSYEPIIRPHTDQSLWIKEIMGKFGYTDSSYRNRVRRYCNDLRNKYSDNWAFTIFVVASGDYDTDGEFDDGYFAYAYLGGPFVVMTYDNDGYGIANMDAVTAHETGHIFCALDEYAGASSVNDFSGYLNIQNGNHEVGGITNVSCIMRGGITPYTNGDLCDYTRGHIGWRDTDDDNILDILDTEPQTYVVAYSPNPTKAATTIEYTGSANVVPYPHQGWGNDITINTIINVEYCINNGLWTNTTAIDGAFDEPEEDFTFIVSGLSEGSYCFEVRSWNSVNNKETSFSRDILRIYDTSDFSEIKVYPNPYKPGSGTQFDRAGGIFFKNLTEETIIKIFNIAGERVFESEEVDFEYEWPGINKSGQKVASGIYIYLLKNKQGQKKTGKLAIIK